MECCHARMHESLLGCIFLLFALHNSRVITVTAVRTKRTITAAIPPPTIAAIDAVAPTVPAVALGNVPLQIAPSYPSLQRHCPAGWLQLPPSTAVSSREELHHIILVV